MQREMTITTLESPLQSSPRSPFSFPSPSFVSPFFFLRALTTLFLNFSLRIYIYVYVTMYRFRTNFYASKFCKKKRRKKIKIVFEPVNFSQEKIYVVDRQKADSQEIPSTPFVSENSRVYFIEPFFAYTKNRQFMPDTRAGRLVIPRRFDRRIYNETYFT